MKVRSTNGSELPADWHPGEPLTGKNIDLRTAQECPFGPECHSCQIGLYWHSGFETHMKPPVADR
jgi:hypothetical protein